MSITLEKTQVHETVQFVLKYRGHMLSFKPLGFDVLTLGIQTAFASEAEAMIQQELANNSFVSQCTEVDTVIGDAMRQIKEHIEINTRVFCYLTNFKYKTMIDIINGPDVEYYNEIVASPAFMSFIHDRFGKDSWDIRKAPAQLRETLNSEVVMEFVTAFEKNPQSVLASILNMGDFGPIETKLNLMHKTPQRVAHEMVSRISTHYLKNPTSTFYDPCCGTGTFIFELIERLQEYHTLSHIITKMVYINDTDHKYTLLVKCQLEALHFSQTGRIISYSNLTNNNFLEYTMNRKFDVIIANPPYLQDMHLDFLTKSYNLANEVVMIHPSTWLLQNKPASENKNSKKYNKIKDLVKNDVVDFTFVNGNAIFGIQMFTPCVITHLRKGIQQSKFVVHDKMINTTDTYNDINDINLFGSDPRICAIKNKILAVAKNNSLEDNVHRGTQPIGCTHFLRLPLGTGNHQDHDESKPVQCANFFTLISSAGCISTDIPAASVNNNIFGFNSYNEAANFEAYIKSNIARFAIGIYKVNQQISRGEMRAVPWFDFTSPVTIERVKGELLLSDDEIELINNIIPAYY